MSLSCVMQSADFDNLTNRNLKVPKWTVRYDYFNSSILVFPIHYQGYIAFIIVNSDDMHLLYVCERSVEIF